MRLWNRIKYHLLRLLLNDICKKSDCEKCMMRTKVMICDFEGMGCEEMDIFYRKIGRLTEEDTLVLAGNVPPSLPSDIYRQILERIHGHGVRTVVDATGDLLLNVLAYRPFLIKPNRAELSEMVGRSLPDDVAIEEAARELQSKGARNVLVSLGGDGALLLDEEGKVHREKALGKKTLYTVGAGDSMVAGFLAGVDSGKGYEYALKLGSAAGSATASSTELATKAEIEALLRGTF
jgi:1-phosphofructokinase